MGLISDILSNNTGAKRILRWLHKVISSWVGSLVVHAVLLLLLILLMPRANYDRSVSGDRATEDVGIVFAPTVSGNTFEQPPAVSTQQQPSQPSISDIVSQHLAELTPQQSVTPFSVIGTIQSVEPAPGGNSASRGQTSAMQADGLVTGSFLGAQGTGRKFVYVLDRSNSTGFGNRRSPLYVAKRELLISLQSLGEAGLRASKPIQFQVIFFNNKTAIFNTVGYGGSDRAGRLLHYNQSAYDQVQHFLGGIIAEGGTLPEPALMQAVRMGADCIFLMTDGDTQLTQAQLQRIRDTAKGVQINVVEYGMGTRSARDNSLQKLATGNHGNHIYVDLSQFPR